MISSREPHAPADVAAHYDDLDYFYRDVWGEHVHHGLWKTGDESRDEAVRALVENVATEARIGKGTRVCDIGCGYGATARLLVREFGAEVTAITVSQAQYDFAKRESNDAHPAFLLGDWLENTLPDASFDSAIAIESSEHMPDLTEFFRQASRVLKPGGRLVVCAWLARENATKSQRDWLLEPICREGRMPAMGTESDYQRIAEETGFRSVRFQDVSKQVESTWPRIVGVFFRKLASEPRYIRFLLDSHARNRVFAVTIFRLWMAYKTGAMRYGIFTLEKGADA